MDDFLLVCAHRDTPGADGEMARRSVLEMTWNQFIQPILYWVTVVKN